MKILGFEVTPEIETACLERMRRGPFTAGAISMAALRAGAPNDAKWTHARIADRLIQRERKAGNITFDGRAWSWVR